MQEKYITKKIWFRSLLSLSFALLCNQNNVRAEEAKKPKSSVIIKKEVKKETESDIIIKEITPVKIEKKSAVSESANLKKKVQSTILESNPNKTEPLKVQNVTKIEKVKAPLVPDIQFIKTLENVQNLEFEIFSYSYFNKIQSSLDLFKLILNSNCSKSPDNCNKNEILNTYSKNILTDLKNKYPEGAKNISEEQVKYLLMNASTFRDELGENNAQKLVQLGDDLNKIDQELFKEKSEEILKQIKNLPAETIQKAETNPPIKNIPVQNISSQPNTTAESTVFVSERDGNPEIYSMNSDGSNQTRLTTNEVYDIMPAWSPDCSKIVFVSERDNNPEIYSMNADGTNQTRLTSNSAYDYSPNWSPDGTKIAFVSNRGTGQNTTGTVNKINYKIFVMNADGSDQVLLTDNSIDDESPKWSPDGKKLAFVSTRDGNPEIYVINSDGTNLVRLTNNKTYDLMPAWSPDGTKIAFRADRDGNPEIYSMNADGSNQTRLTDNSVADESPGWSPDGTKIAFVSKRDNVIDETGIVVSEIYIMNADGYNINRLTNNNFEDYFPNWSKTIPKS